MAISVRPSADYVKFVKGNERTWTLMPLENKKSDTLYFISNDESTTGKLYLGTKLISQGDILNSLTLNSLKDILLSADITDNSLLVYDNNSKKWVSKDLAEVFSIIVSVMQGATEEQDGASGLVPVPKAGQNKLYLRGDGTWANPTASLEIKVNGLLGTDEGKSARTIAAEEVAKVVANAPENFDTLKEIADWIESNTTIQDISGLNSRVGNLENIINDRTIEGSDGSQTVVPGLHSITSKLNDEIYGNGRDKTGLVMITSNLNNTVESLRGSVSTLNSSISDLQSGMEELDNRLKWSEMIEE